MKKTGLWTLCGAVIILAAFAGPVGAVVILEEAMNVRAHGTIAPEATDMAHIHLIYATGSSAPGYHDRGAIKLGDGAAAVGQPMPFDVTFPVSYDVSDPWLTWVIAGTYTEAGPETVSVAMEPEDNPWDGYWEDYFDIAEADVHARLVSEDVVSLAAWLTDEGVMDPSFFSCDLGALPADESSAVIRNFTGLFVHGTAGHVIETAIPEPGSWALWVLGLAGLARKRRK